MLPRTSLSRRSAEPRSGASSLWTWTSCQPDQSPLPVARVRTWTRPRSSAAASSQTTPRSENGRTVRAGRPSDWGVGAGVASRASGRGAGAPSAATGRDWVLPGSSPERAGCGAAAGAALAPVTGTRGRARTAVHTAPRQVARKGRMVKILDMSGANAPTVI
ncbi:hypothetical protein [Streptomyces lydicamycinicus]|uniref:hypothetical protein n=1 Tax=Streptomyces lydicamycinicus TaxID=1546107 RepID=UPI003D808445